MTWTTFEEGAVNALDGLQSWETVRLQPVEPASIPIVVVPPQAPTPLYDQLAELWHSQRRQVPGEPDPEWHALVSRGPGRRRRPSDPWWCGPAW